MDQKPETEQQPEKEDYGRINHPKKPLLTGTLYAVALVVVIVAGSLLNRLFFS